MDWNHRDFSSISPSARTLLLMKGLTNIAFAKQAAELIMHSQPFVSDYEHKDLTFWLRVAHFESRYQSVDHLLADLTVKNILELSSGFSFRGLAAVKEKDVHYIDTDLPGIIEKKKEMITALQDGAFPSKGKLEILPLNALDEKAFMQVVSHFDKGEIVIVNEGLLVYLNREEKLKLCSIIHRVLEQRGGYWITADIYIKQKTAGDSLKMKDQLQDFLDKHHVEENKFDTIEDAEDFFKNAGFVIDKEAEPDYSKVSTINKVLQSATQKQLDKLDKAGKIQTTWRLKIADE